MKWAILEGRYNIKVVKAETAEGAAQVYLSTKEPKTKKSKGKSISRRSMSTPTVQVIDLEMERIREFELAPPPTPPVEEWTIREILEDDDEDEEDDSRF